MPVILATQEADRDQEDQSQFEASPGQIILQDPISKIPNTKKGW
jgi:hypothetical protein